MERAALPATQGRIGVGEVIFALRREQAGTRVAIQSLVPALGVSDHRDLLAVLLEEDARDLVKVEIDVLDVLGANKWFNQEVHLLVRCIDFLEVQSLQLPVPEDEVSQFSVALICLSIKIELADVDLLELLHFLHADKHFAYGRALQVLIAGYVQLSELLHILEHLQECRETVIAQVDLADGESSEV